MRDPFIVMVWTISLILCGALLWFWFWV
jgi:hypothetical protein